jgi:hypothetical protein
MRYTSAIITSIILEIILLVVMLFTDGTLGAITSLAMLIINIILFIHIVKQPSFYDTVWFVFISFVFVCCLVIANMLTTGPAVTVFIAGTAIILTLAAILVSADKANKPTINRRIEVPYRMYQPVVEQPAQQAQEAAQCEPEIQPPEKPADEKIVFVETNNKELERDILDVKRQEREIKRELMQVRSDILKRIAKKEAPKPEEVILIGSKTGSKFHEPGCMVLQTVTKQNRITFKDRRQALSKGYSPCKVCIPPTSGGPATKRRK